MCVLQAYEFFAASRWAMALHTGADGSVQGGSFDALADATRRGSRVKVGVRDLCADLAVGGAACCAHEVFVECGWCFYYPESRKMSAATQVLPPLRPCAWFCAL